VRNQVVLLTDNDLGDRGLEIELLRQHIPGVEVVSANCRDEADVHDQVRTHRPDAIITQWAPITARVLAEADRCRIVSRMGIGLDMIDLEAARDGGIEVRNVAHYCTEEVATHAVALALALWRRLPQMDREVRSGRWEAANMAPFIGRLSDATVGLVGAGHIGSLVGHAFAAWGMRVIVHDSAADSTPYTRVPLEQLAAQSDLISLHAPLTESTRHLVDASFLALAERQPILVNTSRGGLVDIDAVVDALSSGTLNGSGLDVFEEEPLDPAHPITLHPNTILTPHAAWCSRAALPELRRESVMNVVAALTGPERSGGNR
jgi:D-3-phosphoglycerate dehydrogenase